MTPDDSLDSLESGLQDKGIAVAREQLLGRPAVVARWKKFRWRWFATELNLVLMACPFSSSDASTEGLDRFLTTAREYAVAHRQRRPLGLQTGVAVIAVAVGSGLGGDASEWASRPHGSKLAVVAYPVSFDLRTGTTTRPDRMVLGGIYLPYLRHFVDTVVTPALARGC